MQRVKRKLPWVPICALMAMAALPNAISAERLVAQAPAEKVFFATAFMLAIDGATVASSSAIPTQANGWSAGFATHELLRTPAAEAGAIRLLNASGDAWTVRADRAGESWEIEGSAIARADDAIQLKLVLRHNGIMRIEKEMRIEEGKLESLGRDDWSEDIGDRLRFECTIQRISAAQRAAEAATNGAGMFALKTAEAAADAPGRDLSQPVENKASRRMRPPRYPLAAVRAHVTGKVVVNVLVGVNGVPLSAEVFGIEPSGAIELGGAAIAAALQWRYEPAQRNGAPAAGAVLVPIDFTLQDPAGMPMPSPDPRRLIAAAYRRITLPVYPEHALLDHVQGLVFVRAQAGANGRLVSPRVEQIVPETATELGEAALSAVQQWQFTPQSMDGNAYVSEIRIPFEFRLGETMPSALKNAAALEPLAETLQTIVVEPPPAQ